MIAAIVCAFVFTTPAFLLVVFALPAIGWHAAKPPKTETNGETMERVEESLRRMGRL